MVLKLLHSLLDSLVIECWHQVRVVPGSIPSQGPRRTKDKNDTSSSLIEHLTLNREILALSQFVLMSLLHVLKIDQVHGY